MAKLSGVAQPVEMPAPQAAAPGGAAAASGFPVVGIGAAAGGLTALRRFFERTPADAGLAWVVVLHLSPRHHSSVASTLQRATPMPVVEVREAVTVKPGTVYVISPALHLRMAGAQLTVEPAERPRGRHVSIDLFFRTLADAQRERAMAVLLSGTGADGAYGIRRIREQGGVTLVQNPADAEYEAMPRAAIDTGCVDIVLPLDELPAKLVELWHNASRIELPHAADTGLRTAEPPTEQATRDAERALDEIMRVLHSRTGHDFSHYKHATVLRRLERRLQVNSLHSLPGYLALLRAQPDEAGALLRDMLISVTNFFRDADAFDALAQAIGAELQQSNGALPRQMRAWVAGCATGEEVYSVAMLLWEQAAAAHRPPEIQVFGSDIDTQAIATARQGCYAPSIAADMPPNRLRQFFTKDAGRLRVTRPLRDTVLFAQHNVLRDPPFSRMNLVSCRNLLIYLDRTAQRRVLEMFHFSLRAGGLLFLGSAETADAAPDLFSAVDRRHRIYRCNLLPRGTHSLPPLRLAPAPDNKPAPVLAQPGAAARSALRQLHDRLQAQNAAASVLIDEQANILHLSDQAGHSGHYLHFPAGAPSNDLLTVVREGLRLALRTALTKAWDTRQRVQSRPVRLARDGGDVLLTMTALPLRDPVSGTTFMLVTFNEVDVSLGGEPDRAVSPQDALLVELEKELQRTRETLRNSIGSGESFNEDLKAANEELQAMNEELRSATEELDVGREELQSVNEELSTVNQELKDKIDETSRTNDDLGNLIASTDIASVFVDRQMRIKRFTPRTLDLFNILPADVGRPLSDLTHRLDYPQLEADARQAFDSLQLVERAVAGPGDRSFLARVLPFRTREDRIEGAVLSFVDISATRRAERRLRDGEVQMRLVAENTPDFAIVTLDNAGLVTGWNRGAELLFGHTAEQIIGSSGDLLFTPEDRAAGAPEAERRTARDTGRAEDDRWHQRRDGSRVFVSGVTTPLLDDALHGYAKIARDITDNQRTQTQRDSSLEAERVLRAELQKASALKDEFLAVMSHELKHPLNLIHVNAELLTRMPQVRNVEAVARVADVIRSTVVAQARIIDDLLDLSRMHTGKLSLNIRSVEWLPIIERVVEAARGDAEAGQLQVHSTLDPAAASVLADPLRVEQIAWNLLSNALKFTPPGGEVWVRVLADGTQARLEVQDNGVGIDGRFLPFVFDMFRQADSRFTREQGGLGIGLALVKHLAELMSGSVQAASEGLGGGTRFSVWLPLADGAPASAAPAQDGLPLAGMRILVVDDTLDTLESFTMLLNMEGAEVTACASGAAALEAAAHESFDLVLSDVGMPQMDGHQLATALRQRPRSAALPMVALTGYGRRQDEERALAAGFDAHLAKPVALAALLDTIARVRESRMGQTRK